MSIFEIIMTGIALAMDAFAVSICKGMYLKKTNYKCIVIALYFSIFQMLMPLIGFLLGSSFANIISSVDHYIAFILLSFIGISMVIDKDKEDMDDDTSFKTMILLSIATSIDALIVGVTLAFLKTNLLISILVIGIITFIMCLAGTVIGIKFKNKFGGSKVIGGIILILMGLKILIEHLLQ